MPAAQSYIRPCFHQIIPPHSYITSVLQLCAQIQLTHAKMTLRVLHPLPVTATPLTRDANALHNRVKHL